MLHIYIFIVCIIFCRTDFKVVSLKFKKDDAKKKTTTNGRLVGQIVVRCALFCMCLYSVCVYVCVFACTRVWEIMHVNVGSKPRLTVIAKNVR